MLVTSLCSGKQIDTLFFWGGGGEDYIWGAYRGTLHWEQTRQSALQTCSHAGHIRNQCARERAPLWCRTGTSP